MLPRDAPVVAWAKQVSELRHLPLQARAKLFQRFFGIAYWLFSQELPPAFPVAMWTP